MALRDLIPWNNGSRDVSLYRSEPSPFVALHREMNRLFDDAFRSFDIAPFSSQAMGWPNVEVNETANEVKVIAEDSLNGWQLVSCHPYYGLSTC